MLNYPCTRPWTIRNTKRCFPDMNRKTWSLNPTWTSHVLRTTGTQGSPSSLPVVLTLQNPIHHMNLKILLHMFIRAHKKYCWMILKKKPTSYKGGYRHTSFYCASFFHFKDIAFLLIKSSWQPWVEQVCKCHFSNSICSFLDSVSHFGNSHNISKIFHCYYICYSDLWCYYCNYFGVLWMVPI